MRPTHRAVAFALAGLTTISAASLAAPDRTGDAQAASPAQLAVLAPLSEMGRGPAGRAARRPGGGAFTRRIQNLAASAARAVASRPRFPVIGEFNWGQREARFGASRSGHVHAGQDVFARTGTPLMAVRDGVVLETGDDGGRGNYVAIYDPPLRRTYVYLHMNRPSRVRAGGRVRGGTRVGEVGCTGSCFGDHLHFEVRRGRDIEGVASDPLPLLRRWAAAAGVRPTLAPGAH